MEAHDYLSYTNSPAARYIFLDFLKKKIQKGCRYVRAKLDLQVFQKHFKNCPVKRQFAHKQHFNKKAKHTVSNVYKSKSHSKPPPKVPPKHPEYPKTNEKAKYL